MLKYFNFLENLALNIVSTFLKRYFNTETPTYFSHISMLKAGSMLAGFDQGLVDPYFSGLP